MGWIGTPEQLREQLLQLRADVDEEGRYVVRGGIFSFLGAPDGDVCVADDAECSIGGRWVPLAARLHDRAGTHVVVISANHHRGGDAA